MEARGPALVTGASRGLGRAIAVELARVGFDVLAGMRNPEDGRDLAGTLRVERLDVTDLADFTVPAGLRVLVNNAGIEREYLPVEHTDAADWRAVFETNVFGLVELTRRAIPELRAAGGGVICNITSSSVLVPVPFYAVYRASKAAVSALGETLRVELKDFGIRVIEILPGPIDTDLLAASDRLPEGGGFPGYAELAENMLAGRRSIGSTVTSPANAAVAIRTAILDDRGPVRHSCDPLGQALITAWRAAPEG